MFVWRVVRLSCLAIIGAAPAVAQTPEDAQAAVEHAGQPGEPQAPEAEPPAAPEQAVASEPAPAVDPGAAENWANVSYPEDPFADSYRMPRKRELGTVAGQFRMIGTALVNPRGADSELGLHGTLELMTFAYLGVRGSLQTTLFKPHDVPLVFAAKAGAALHVLPYRRVDLSFYFEGGVGVVAPTKPNSAPMPLCSPGLTFDIWLSHWAFLHTDVHLDWGIYERANAAHNYVRVGTLLGLGIAL